MLRGINEDFVRIAPRPTERPTVQAGPKFSPQLNLTPEKEPNRGRKDCNRTVTEKLKHGSETRSQPKQWNAVPETGIYVERNDKAESCQSLVKPSVNSSARISRKLQQLQESKYNPAVAIAEELQKSETTRTAFSEKIASGVNVKWDKNKYSGLIPLDVDPEGLISAHVQQRVSFKAKATKTPDDEPQIMDFFSEQFEEETARFDFPALNEVNEELTSLISSEDHAFDLYRHTRCWEHSWR